MTATLGAMKAARKPARRLAVESHAVHSCYLMNGMYANTLCRYR